MTSSHDVNTSHKQHRSAPIDQERIKTGLANREFRFLRKSLKDMETADMAEIFIDLEPQEYIPLFRLIPRVRRPLFFSYLPIENQQALIDNLPDNVVTHLINEMEADDRTRLLEELPEESQAHMIMQLSPEERKVAWELLSYGESTVGRLMNPEYIALRADMNVSQALEWIRWQPGLPEEQISQLFIVDELGHYKGEISLAALVMTDPVTTLIQSLMAKNQVYLNVSDDVETAVDTFRKYDRISFPVLDEQFKLRGVVTADDVFDVAEEEATEDWQQFGGQSTLENPYFSTSILTMIKKRAGWLSILFLGQFLTGAAMHHYDVALSKYEFLIFFIPLILSSGGNSGSQAASLIIRGLAVREIELRDWWKIMGRELIMGIGLGLILGVLGVFRALTWDYSILESCVVMLTLVGVVMFGALIGAMLPFGFKRLNLDPAVSSSPFIASLADFAGIVLFINIALFFLA